MMGWLKGPIHPKFVKLTEDGLSEDQLINLQSLDVSLAEQLQEIRNALSQRLIDTAEAEASDAELKIKHDDFDRFKALIKTAFRYMSELDNELAKGESSELIIDHDAGETSGTTHITLASLDRWAQENFSISIIDDPNSTAESSENRPASEQEDKADGKWLSKTVADNLYTTLGFLVEAFAATSDKYGRQKPNVQEISTHLEKLANKASKFTNLSGQGNEAIKSRIEKALQVKKSKLEKK
jgi:hypothetical protein